MITARVDAVGTANTPKARVALMLREGAAGPAVAHRRHVLISVNAQGVVQFQRRDRSTNFDPGQMKDGLRPPVWLRLARVDDPATNRTTVTGYYSTDGNDLDPARRRLLRHARSHPGRGAVQLGGGAQLLHHPAERLGAQHHAAHRSRRRRAAPMPGRRRRRPGWVSEHAGRSALALACCRGRLLG